MTENVSGVTPWPASPPPDLLFRPEWQRRGACVGAKNPDIFFPSRGASPTRAMEVCSGCPVKKECLEMALNISDAEDRLGRGVFGGTTYKQRERMRTERNRKRSAA